MKSESKINMTKRTVLCIASIVSCATAIGATTAVPAPYLQLDLSTGEMTALAARPEGGWSFADYEMRIVFKRDESAATPFYLAVFDVTVAQWAGVMGGTDDDKENDATKTGVSRTEIRGLLSDAVFPITYGSFLARLRERAKLNGFELPESERESTSDGFRIAYYPAIDGRAWMVETETPTEPGEPTSSVVEPTAANLAAHLELPPYVYPGEIAAGRIVYSNRLASTALAAPMFVLSATGDAEFSSGGARLCLATPSDLPPSAGGELTFLFAASAHHSVSLSLVDATKPARPASAAKLRDSSASECPPFAAVLPAGPKPLTTGFVVLGDGRRVASCEWDFDADGIVDSRDLSPVATFADEGTHAVSVAVTYADGETASYSIADAVRVWDAPDAQYVARTVLVGAAECPYSVVEDSGSVLVLRSNGENPAAIAEGSVIILHLKAYAPLKAMKVVGLDDGTLRVEVAPCPLTDAYSVLSLSSLVRARKGGTQSSEIYSLPDVSNEFAIAMGDAARLDLRLTNALAFAFSVDIRGGKVRRFYGGVAGTFGVDLATSNRTPQGLLEKEIPATTDFGTPPLMRWAGPKVKASAVVGADLALTARGRYAKGILYDRGSVSHIGGAVLEDFDRERDVHCPLAFADATIFAGLEIGAALGWDVLGGSLAATVLALSADAGVRADAEVGANEGIRSLDLKVRPVVELSFVPVSVSVFDVVDWTPVTKSHTFEGDAWTFHWDDAAARPVTDGGELVPLQTLPVAVLAHGAVIAPVNVPQKVAGTDAGSWLTKNGLVVLGADDAAMRNVLARPTGKTTASGTSAAVWHDYVAGTDPKNTTNVFTATISVLNGLPVIRWSPDLSGRRRYEIKGASSPVDEFVSPTNSTHRFFKVDVSLP